MTMEQRHLVIENLTTRELPNHEMVVEGVAVRYGQPSNDLGGFIEYVERGALDVSLRENDIAMLYNHKTDHILGRTSAGTLSLQDMPDGLHFRVSMPNNTIGKDVYESLKRGDIRGCSFGFATRDDDWDFSDRMTAKRYLKDVDLREISFTPFPAYESTSVNVRAFEEAKEKNELEQKLIDEVDAHLKKREEL